MYPYRASNVVRLHSKNIYIYFNSTSKNETAGAGKHKYKREKRHD